MEYKYIRMWGRMLGSNANYIDEEVLTAQGSGAPENATYQRPDGTWETTDGITNPETRRYLGLD